MGLTLGAGASEASQSSRPSTLATLISVRRLDPSPRSRLRMAPTLTAAAAASPTWSIPAASRTARNCSPMLASHSSVLRAGAADGEVLARGEFCRAVGVSLDAPILINLVLQMQSLLYSHLSNY